MKLELVACKTIVVALTPQRGMPLSSYLARNFAATIVYLNSSLNPFLYCWKIREVRQAVKETLRQLFCWSSWFSMHSTILDKSPLDSTSIFILFCHFSVPSIKQCIIFEIFLQFSLPPPYKKVETLKTFWIHASNIVCEVRGRVWPVWIGKRPRNAKVSQDFCPWL